MVTAAVIDNLSQIRRNGRAGNHRRIIAAFNRNHDPLDKAQAANSFGRRHVIDLRDALAICQRIDNRHLGREGRRIGDRCADVKGPLHRAIAIALNRIREPRLEHPKEGAIGAGNIRHRDRVAIGHIVVMHTKGAGGAKGRGILAKHPIFALGHRSVQIILTRHQFRRIVQIGQRDRQDRRRGVARVIRTGHGNIKARAVLFEVKEPARGLGVDDLDHETVLAIADNLDMRVNRRFPCQGIGRAISTRQLGQNDGRASGRSILIGDFGDRDRLGLRGCALGVNRGAGRHFGHSKHHIAAHVLRPRHTHCDRGQIDILIHNRIGDRQAQAIHRPCALGFCKAADRRHIQSDRRINSRIHRFVERNRQRDKVIDITVNHGAFNARAPRKGHGRNHRWGGVQIKAI